MAPPRGPAAAARDDASLVAALRDGDTDAFAALVERHHNNLVRVARAWVRRPEIAEEVAQEAWIGVIRGLAAFEGRCALTTWIYQIAINLAKRRAEREGRQLSFSDLAAPELGAEDAVPPECFLPAGHPRWPNHWKDAPAAWPSADDPERALLSAEAMEVLREALESLPPAQRQVITLRDIEGMSSAEACNVLGVSETNQRVLLHRGRARLRNALKAHFQGGGR